MGRTTNNPLICLMNWDIPECKNDVYKMPPLPKFAPNYKINKYKNNEDFFTPVYPIKQDKSSTPKTFYTTSSGKHSRKGKHKLKTTTSNPQISNIDLSSKEKFNKKYTIINPDTKIYNKSTEKNFSPTPKLFIDSTKKAMIDNTISIEIDVPNDSINDDDYSERWWSDIGAPTFNFITHTTISPTINIKDDNIKTTISPSKIIESNQQNLKKLEMTSTNKEPYQLMKDLTPTTSPFSEFTTKSSLSITKAIATLATTVLHIQTTTFQPITNSPYIFSNTNNPSTTTIYAVRPTTPMGTTLSGTMNGSKNTTGQQDFPRTALISIASISVIFIIAIVVFCVFRCRQAAPGSEHYPVYVNGHKPPGIISMGGYTPVPTEMSPQMMQHSHYDGPIMSNKQHNIFTSDTNALLNCPNGHNHINVGTTIKPNLNNVSLTNGVTPCQNSYGLSNSACMSATLPNKSNSMLHRQYPDNTMLNNNSHTNGQLYHTIGRNGLMTSSLNKTNGMSTLETKKRAFKEWYV